MCDTLFKKIGDNAIFLKNSDRAANEPNLVVFCPARKASESLKCTYITIEDMDSYASLLYKPSWIWGAEMGINEKGVTIGNEAVWTKSKDKKTERLLGMDLLRLGLERGESAKGALEVIIKLLEEYGQGGNAGYDHPFYYDNSFLITDGKECYILETAGKNWAWRKVNEGNISNRLSLTDNYDQSSVSGNFLKENFEPIYSFFSGSKQRMECGARKLADIKEFSLSQSFASLRAHYKDASDSKLFGKGSVKSVCMHAGGIGDHTTGSMAVFYISGKPYVWVTGSSTPCLSVFKPVSFDKVQAPVFDNENDSVAYFLLREKVNRAIYGGLIDVKVHREKIAKLEHTFIERFNDFLAKGDEDYEKLCKDCAAEEQKLYDSYEEAIILDNNKGYLSSYWQKKNEKLGKNVFDLSWRNK